uniref:hypothetical protein n=1 Tax=Stutzerimonas kunmingensis TaxID=1211807 RepID=UPI0028B1E828|nr:hypothetical protein [Stutzerimonas kunmingensis]
MSVCLHWTTQILRPCEQNRFDALRSSLTKQSKTQHHAHNPNLSQPGQTLTGL